MKQRIIIQNSENFFRLKNEIRREGPENFHIVSDFDKTLTKESVNGDRVQSLISVLRDEKYLSPDYPEKAHTLFNHYHPLEIDSKIPLAERKRAMHEWWTKHIELLIECGLNRKDVIRAVESSRIRFREGIPELIDFLERKLIPFVIISSGGLGTEAISLCLKKRRLLRSNVYIISNDLIWDEKGFAAGIKGSVIHVLNKDEISLKNFLFFEKVESRKNVLLLGDSLDDIGMVSGFDCRNLIKIGFLNESSSEMESEFRKNFDVIIPDDESAKFVADLVKELFV